MRLNNIEFMGYQGKNALPNCIPNIYKRNFMQQTNKIFWLKTNTWQSYILMDKRNIFHIKLETKYLFYILH